MSESGVVKNVRAGWKTTSPRPLFYKELKDTIMQFLSQTLTEHHCLRNCEPPNKSLLQNYHCSASHRTMYAIHVTFPHLMDGRLEVLLLSGSSVIGIDPFRSSRPEVLCEKGVLRNFSKFTGKHLCQSPLF